MKIENTAELVKWLEQQAEAVRFGEVSLKIILHDNRKVRIEKSVVTKEMESTT